MINDLLKFLSVKENYDKYRRYIGKGALPKEVLELLDFFPREFERNGNCITDFNSLFYSFSLSHPGSKNTALIQSLCQVLESTKGTKESDEVVQLFIDRCTAEEMADYCMKIAEGNGGDFVGVSKMLDNYKAISRKLSKELKANEQIDILSRLMSIKTGGYKWNMECLNSLLGSLSTELIIVASRPDGGKTTFLANEAWFIAKQLPPGKVVLWFNNEEHVNRVARRVVQSCLGQDENYIRTNPIAASRLYEREIGGKDRIVFIDDATSMATIERALETYDPGLIIVDQLYKVKDTGFKAEIDAESFRQKCAYARELAKHIAPVIVTNQLDASAENVMYPTMDALYGSKTGAQGEADGIILIGKNYATPDKRYIYTPKNKMTGKVDKYEVLLHKDIARYESL